MARWELQPDREISWAPSFVLRYSVYISSTFITLIQHRLSSSSTTSISTPITTVVQVNKNMRDLPTLFFPLQVGSMEQYQEIHTKYWPSWFAPANSEFFECNNPKS